MDKLINEKIEEMFDSHCFEIADYTGERQIMEIEEFTEASKELLKWHNKQSELDKLKIQLADLILKYTFLMDRNSRFIKELVAFDHDKFYELIQRIQELEK